MSAEIIQIIIATYPTPAAAEQALKALRLSKREQGVEVHDAAVVRRDEHGKLHIHEIQDVTGGRGATVGGILGGVLGILAGPGGVVVGAAVGAVVGGATASVLDKGIPHQRLTTIGQTLKPGAAALVILTEAGFTDFIQTVISAQVIDVHTESMNADAAQQLGHDHDVSRQGAQSG